MKNAETRYNLKWESPENVRENIMRNDAGEAIYTLAKITHKYSLLPYNLSKMTLKSHSEFL